MCRLYANLPLPLFGLIRRTTNWYFFLTFPRKQDLTFHANCFHSRQFAWIVKTIFWEIKKYLNMSSEIFNYNMLMWFTRVYTSTNYSKVQYDSLSPEHCSRSLVIYSYIYVYSDISYGAVIHWCVSQTCVGCFEKEWLSPKRQKEVGSTLLTHFSSVTYAWYKSLYAGVHLGSKNVSMHKKSGAPRVTYTFHMRYRRVEYLRARLAQVWGTSGTLHTCSDFLRPWVGRLQGASVICPNHASIARLTYATRL